MEAPIKLKFTDYQLHMIQGLTVTDESHHEYIRKDALLEWLNEAIIAANNDGIRVGFKRVQTKIELL